MHLPVGCFALKVGVVCKHAKIKVIPRLERVLKHALRGGMDRCVTVKLISLLNPGPHSLNRIPGKVLESKGGWCNI